MLGDGGIKVGEKERKVGDRELGRGLRHYWSAGVGLRYAYATVIRMREQDPRIEND